MKGSIVAVTLDSIREGLERKYKAFEVEISDGEVLSFKNPMRMDDAELERFAEVSERLDGAKFGEYVEIFKEILAIASDDWTVEKLSNHIGGDRALWTAVVEQYMDEQRVGEASPSHD